MIGSQLPLTVTPADAVALVQLKSLFDEARRATQRRGLRRKLISVVLLDATNESALNLVATSLGLELSPAEKFDGLKSKVDDKLGAEANALRSSWRDVRKLHLARNLAQHHGVQTSEDQISAWLAATYVFANSLTQTVFGKTLSEVRLADAIDSGDVRAMVSSAEDELAARDYYRATTWTFMAFETASRRWQEQAEIDINPLSRPSVFDIVDRKSFDHLERLAKSALDLAHHQAIGPAASDYAWFSQLRSDGADNVNAAEAERALSFVYWWIIDWEAASQEFVKDRLDRRILEERQARYNGGKFDITDVSVSQVFSRLAGGPEDDGISRVFRVSLRCAGLPVDKKEFGRWQAAVRQTVEEVDSVMYPHLTTDGYLQFEIATADRASAIVSQVRAKLQSLSEIVEQSLRAETEIDEQAAERRRTYQEAVLKVRAEFPSWLGGIRLSNPDEFMGENSIRIQLVDPEALPIVGKLLRDQPQIAQAVNDDFEIAINPALEPIQLLELLQPISQAMSDAEENRRRRENEVNDDVSAIRVTMAQLKGL